MSEAQDTSDAYHLDYQYEAQRSIVHVTKTFKGKVYRMVLQLDLSSTAVANMAAIDKSAVWTVIEDQLELGRPQALINKPAVAANVASAHFLFQVFA